MLQFVKRASDKLNALTIKLLDKLLDALSRAAPQGQRERPHDAPAERPVPVNAQTTLDVFDRVLGDPDLNDPKFVKRVLDRRAVADKATAAGDTYWAVTFLAVGASNAQFRPTVPALTGERLAAHSGRKRPRHGGTSMTDSELTVDLPLPAGQERIVKEACARFEAAWKTVGPDDPAPDIAEFLNVTEAPSSAVLLQHLVSLDVEHRRQRGDQPTAPEYAARFPELSGRLFRSTEAIADGPHAVPVSESGAPRSTVAQDDPPDVESTVTLPLLRPKLRSTRYVVRGFHARGGIGEVHRAEDAEIGRIVALKRLRPDKGDQKDRFLVEAQVTGQLEHPGIVPVHDLGVDEQGAPFYVMSFIHGKTLKAVIADHHADSPQSGEAREVRTARLLEIFVRICEAVAYRTVAACCIAT